MKKIDVWEYNNPRNEAGTIHRVMIETKRTETSPKPRISPVGSEKNSKSLETVSEIKL